METLTDKLKNKPKNIHNVKQARRLMAAIIKEIQTETITNEKARLLIYALIKFGELWKLETLDSYSDRLDKIDEILEQRTDVN